MSWLGRSGNGSRLHGDKLSLVPRNHLANNGAPKALRRGEGPGNHVLKLARGPTWMAGTTPGRNDSGLGWAISDRLGALGSGSSAGTTPRECRERTARYFANERDGASCRANASTLSLARG